MRGCPFCLRMVRVPVRPEKPNGKTSEAALPRVFRNELNTTFLFGRRQKRGCAI